MCRVLIAVNMHAQTLTQGMLKCTCSLSHSESKSLRPFYNVLHGSMLAEMIVLQCVECL